MVSVRQLCPRQSKWGQLLRQIDRHGRLIFPALEYFGGSYVRHYLADSADYRAGDTVRAELSEYGREGFGRDVLTSRVEFCSSLILYVCAGKEARLDLP